MCSSCRRGSAAETPTAGTFPQSRPHACILRRAVRPAAVGPSQSGSVPTAGACRRKPRCASIALIPPESAAENPTPRPDR